MADNKLIEQSGQRLFNSDGDTANNGTITVYDAGTTDLHPVFTDADLLVAAANPTSFDGSGLCPYLYVGTASYKVVIKESGGEIIDTEDNISGALDTTDLDTDFAKVDSDVAAKTDDYTVVANDLGTVLTMNPGAVTKTFTLISAVTATNGRGVTLMDIGTGGGQTDIDTVNSETITRIGEAATSMSLFGRGQAVTLVSDGANWVVSMEAGTGFDTGTEMVFGNTTAPTGWTKQATHNDKSLRLVTGTPSTGGSLAFTTVFGITATDATTILESTMPSHTHTYTYRGSTNSGGGAAFTAWQNTSTPNTGSKGDDGSHTHPLDLQVQYVDYIEADKD